MLKRNDAEWAILPVSYLLGIDVYDDALAGRPGILCAVVHERKRSSFLICISEHMKQRREPDQRVVSPLLSLFSFHPHPKWIPFITRICIQTSLARVQIRQHRTAS